MKYAVNCSIVFTELPLLERPAAAKAAGFEAIEFWWPFSTAVPGGEEVTAFIAAIRDAGVSLAAINFFGGDIPAGDRGTLCWIARQEEFRASVPVSMRVGAALGCNTFNALYGLRRDDEDAAAQDATALENLAFAARAVSGVGGTVLLEALSGAAAYPLLKAADVADVIARLRDEYGITNVRMLADLYHLHTNGDDVAKVCAERATEIGHCQIADSPGRGEPGTGELPLGDWLASLRQHGYDGFVGLEYKPTVASAESFGRLPALV